MPPLQLSGLQVTKITYAPQTPFVSHGQFRAANGADAPMTLVVTEVAIQLGATILPAANFYLYRLPGYDEQPGGRATLAPHASETFEVTFPRVSLAGHSINDEIQVLLTISAGGAATRVASPSRFSIRTPRR